MQGAGALLGETEMLLAQSLERLMLSDLHTRAHIAVTVYEEGECARQVLAASQMERGIVMFRVLFAPSMSTSLSKIKNNKTHTGLKLNLSGSTQS